MKMNDGEIECTGGERQWWCVYVWSVYTDVRKGGMCVGDETFDFSSLLLLVP